MILVRAERSGLRGFTIIELVVVVAVLGLLATVVTPSYFAVMERSRKTVAKELLRSVASAMKRFHDETGAWPKAGGTWNPTSDATVEPVAATSADTALFTVPVAMSTKPHCAKVGGPMATPCWGGPYLGQANSLADRALQDPWGRPIRYAYLAKGHASAPNGLIVIWSTGKDGRNDTTVPADFARGISSSPESDDIIQVVGSAW